MVTPAGRGMQRWKWNPSSYPEHEMPVADLSFPLLLLGGDINPMTVQTCPLIVNISRGGQTSRRGVGWGAGADQSLISNGETHSEGALTFRNHVYFIYHMLRLFGIDQSSSGSWTTRSRGRKTPLLGLKGHGIDLTKMDASLRLRWATPLIPCAARNSPPGTIRWLRFWWCIPRPPCTES